MAPKEEEEEQDDVDVDQLPDMLAHLPTKARKNAKAKESIKQPSVVTDEPLSVVSFTKGLFIFDNHKMEPGEVYDYDKSTPLGEGGYGIVYKATHRVTGAVRAMKQISKRRVKDLPALRAEIEFMKRFDHPNIVKLYETFEDKQHVFLVMECCEGGEVLEKLVSKGSPCPGLQEPEVGHVMRQTFRAVRYLHSHGVAHRDLKLENMLLVRKGVGCDETPVKVIDFGLAKRVPPEKLTEQKGTKWFLAPELLDGKPYGIEVDMWACGVIMFMLLSGMPPFYHKANPNDEEATYDAICSAPLKFPAPKWKHRSAGAKALIRNLLNRDVERRMTAVQALEDQWLNEVAPKPYNHPIGAEDLENLRSFFHKKMLAQASFEVIVLRVAERAIKQWKDLFLTIDEKGMGAISADALAHALKDAGIHDTAAAKEVLELMRTREKPLNYTEFLAAAMDKKELIKPEYCRAAFRVFDRNMDGKLDADELAIVFGDDAGATPRGTSTSEMMKRLGIEGDMLTYNDYCTMVGLHGDPGQPFVADDQTRTRLSQKQAVGTAGGTSGCTACSIL
mmetsp:Transcript_10952/g.23470  ORF Transcript_10952/g.23470 Transcript_10952/m.23470 type:complete len:561 (-) Transcript_10952:136-1818(-)|eukprot:CAMPEP_0204350446 /NCGR_PEP_ID=MMETSP0469-20131031/30319_1 /ASSEMBLY_ACC=CAM_ASM_000384 /TAXON_ID=2969 /ORGANISM="Oxyrrhis marina" /LENGTH=560 /DNA_ID=CAMNT_0051336799 /DNA_START=55 /DNA_END=1737 /DNA_ORIENTATION=-